MYNIVFNYVAAKKLSSNNMCMVSILRHSYCDLVMFSYLTEQG